jgi:hypothetical protein
MRKYVTEPQALQGNSGIENLTMEGGELTDENWCLLFFTHCRPTPRIERVTLELYSDWNDLEQNQRPQWLDATEMLQHNKQWYMDSTYQMLLRMKKCIRTTIKFRLERNQYCLKRNVILKWIRRFVPNR